MRPDGQKSRNPYVLIGIGVVVVLLAIFLVRSFTTETVDVRVAPATHENIISSVSTNGKVEPVNPFQAHAPFSGVIQKVYVQVGQKVRKGDLLVKMDDSDAIQRVTATQSAYQTIQGAASDMSQGGTQEERLANQGELTRAQLQQQQATKDLDALRTLQAKGAASTAEVNAAEQRLVSANNGLQAIQTRMKERFGSTDQAKVRAQLVDARAQVAAARSNISHIDIRAPFAGTVYSLPITEYDFVPGGDDLMDVADLDRIQVRAYFDEPEIGKLAKGQAVKIVWDAKPTQAWHGHIERAPTTVITYGTRNVGECIITVDDARGELLPNTNVTVTVTTSQRFNVLSIPREALHTDGANNYVFRVVGRKLVRTPVQVGVVSLTRAEILSGLGDKDTVATNATSNRDLTNGLEINPVE